ncbi:unnamed protein product [Sphenostylis stenocarpa]|uniref:Major facilitator superfamily (MFS) profile domain-containing protein n=1 Tax=Sphenostylis stenocarpa TaxID=92480 RepID=A0AA86VQ05_9FABA|nr:unnamed protein product [Sphenostylis stenocarpa]
MISLHLVSAAIGSNQYPVPKIFSFYRAKTKPKSHSLICSFRHRSNKLRVSALKNEIPESPQTRNVADDEGSEKLLLRQNDANLDLGWLPVFPHVLVASMSNFIFGYHIGVMNGPIVSIARELGFEGNSFIEGLVVSIFISGAFIGSICSGSLVDKLGCRLTFQIDSIPLILGAIISAHAHSLNEIIGGRFLVGLGIGVNTVLVPIYISEVMFIVYVVLEEQLLSCLKGN